MLVEASCRECRRPFKKVVGLNGLAASRCCPACRKAKRIRQRRLRKVAVNRIGKPVDRVLKDSKSRVTRKGYERLYGADWTDRRKETFLKCGGLCHFCFLVCNWPNGHAHHIKHRSKGRDDKLENLLWAHPECHRKEHNRVLKWSKKGESA